MTKELLICTKCRHSFMQKDVWACNHPDSFMGQNPVDGELIYQYCWGRRQEGSTCGPEGKQFEPSYR